MRCQLSPNCLQIFPHTPHDGASLPARIWESVVQLNGRTCENYTFKITLEHYTCMNTKIKNCICDSWDFFLSLHSYMWVVYLIIIGRSSQELSIEIIKDNNLLPSRRLVFIKIIPELKILQVLLTFMYCISLFLTFFLPLKNTCTTWCCHLHASMYGH